jgi:DNA modification methylase
MKVSEMTAKKKAVDNSSEREPEPAGARRAGAGRPRPPGKLTPHAREVADGEALAARFPRYRMVKTDELVPYENNPRTHSDSQLKKIVASIREFGFTNPILTDGDAGVIAGHGRLLAAQQLGLETVPTIELKHLTPAQRKAYVIADNKLALDSDWDLDLLRLELGDLRDMGFDLDLTGFDPMEADKILGPAGGNTDPDDVPEVQAEAVSVLGDVWLLGRHRVVCGDATDAAVLAVLMGGRPVDLVITSPPYNQQLDKFKPSGMQRESGWVKRIAGAYADTMPERDYQEWQRKLMGIWHEAMRDGASVFYNHKHRYRDKRVVSPMEWLPGPFNFRQEIIWNRPGSVTQNARMFMPCDERIYWLYRGDNFTFADTTEVKSWSSVWDINPGSDFHAVGFPVELPTRCIRAASMPDDGVLDPFVGSGTTIIAAEMTGRVCHAIEISPNYVDVAIRRWQAFAGANATLNGDGRTFAEVERARLSVTA